MNLDERIEDVLIRVRNGERFARGDNVLYSEMLELDIGVDKITSLFKELAEEIIGEDQDGKLVAGMAEPGHEAVQALTAVLVRNQLRQEQHKKLGEML